MTIPLEVRDATVGYDGHVVSRNLNLAIPDRSFTVILGPNACGKSTLLRSLARLLQPREGSVLLDGREIAELPSRQVARRLGLLPQHSVAPEGITDLADRKVDALSGGQRQRVWISLVLAQETPLLLLDEPTTFLDITHQLKVLNLCRTLHDTGDYTLVAVLHDLNLAFRYATHLIVMKDGRVVAEGRPEDIVTAELIGEVYQIECICIPDLVTGRPMIIPTT